ncbi:hypothetical protein CR513_15620, partial [Mucuna pruriens]
MVVDKRGGNRLYVQIVAKDSKSMQDNKFLGWSCEGATLRVHTSTSKASIGTIIESSSTQLRLSETELVQLYCVHLRLAETVLDPSLPRPYETNLCQERVDILHSKLEQMENNDRTLKELATPDVVYQHWCIQYPQLEPAQTYELKPGFIHLLPEFHGLASEDPHKHLKEFHVVCSTMRPQGIPEDYIKMKAFLFSLDGAANDWLYL